jgi:hypothetical protein
MESSSSSEVPSGSVYVEVGNSGNEQPHQSFFSLLLDIETRLRAQARRNAQLQAAPAKTQKIQKEQESLAVH